MTIKITRTPIEVKLVHADDWKSLLKHAWMTSRPNITEDQMNNHDEYIKILKIDTPVSEIPGVVVELFIPMIFREVLANMRDHIMWAQTSRVLNLTEEWNIVDKIASADIPKIEELASQLLKDKNAGLSQDEYRRHLPLSYMSGMTCRFSLRTLFKVTKYFEHIYKNFDELKYAAEDIFIQLLKIGRDVVGLGYWDVYDTIKFQDIVPAYKMIESISHSTEFSKNAASHNHTTVTVDIPLSLRAQLIRHRTISVVDNLLDLMMMDGVLSTAHSVIMTVEVSASNYVWESIISKRNCWVAQVDLWKPLIDEVNKHIHTKELILPCNNGICPYSGDCVERLKRTDPGVPCPRHALLMDGKGGLDVSDYISSSHQLGELVDQTKAYVLKTGRDPQYWNPQIDALQVHMTE